MRAPSSVLLVLLVGCKGCQEEEVWEPNLEVLDPTAVGVYVGDGTGIGSVDVPYFAVNTLGAAVPAEGLTGDGTVDGFGWGTTTVEVGANELVPVVASLSGEDATGFAYGAAAMGLQGDRVIVPWGTATQLAAAGDGVVWVDGAALWWADPRQDAPPVKVLDVSSVEDQVVRIYPASVDGDGVTDLVVWTQERVILLRGRAGGGLIWGTGAWASFGAIGAVGVGDLDGDGDQDVMAAVNADVDSVVAFLRQDDVWAFSETEGMVTGFNVYGVAAQDYDRSGDAELSLLTSDALVRRYGLYEGKWISATSAELDVGISEGGVMLPSDDFTADGVDDILVAGPKGDAATVAVLSFADGPVIYPTFAGGSEPAKVSVATMDVTGDGASDVFIGTDTALIVAGWNPSSGTLYTRRFEIDQSLDGVGLVNLDDDGVVDIALLEGGVRVAAGVVDETDSWNLDVERGLSFSFDLTGAPRIGDVTGDGVVDLVGFRDAGTGPILQVLHGRAPADGTSETLLAGNNAAYGGAAIARDLAVCGADVWAIVEVGGTGNLYRYLVDADGNLDAVGVGVDVGTGYQLACGDFGGGVVVEVIDANGNTRAWDDAGAELPVGDLGAAWRDVAAVTVDGQDTLVGCDCALSVGDVDGVGDDDVLEVSSDASSLMVDGVAYALPGADTGTLTDADGDGLDDVVLQSGNAVTVWRLIGGRIAPGVGRYAQRDLVGVSGYGDLDQAEGPDLFAVGSDGALVYLPTR